MGDQLDMRGPEELVDRGDFEALVAAIHQRPCIPGECRRVAGHINDPLHFRVRQSRRLLACALDAVIGQILPDAHKKPLTDTEVIRCDTASLCSVNLLKVILAHHGLSPRLEPFGDYAQAAGQDAVLLIGNPGIEFLRQPHEHQILDLGQAWQDSTGLPFVFAVWAIRRDCSDPVLGQKLLRIKRDGQAHLEEIIANHSEFDAELRNAYLREHIRFDLGEPEKRGIAEFVHRLREVSSDPVFDPQFISAE